MAAPFGNVTGGDDQIHAAGRYLRCRQPPERRDGCLRRDPGPQVELQEMMRVRPLSEIPNRGMPIEPWSLTLEGFLQLAGDLVGHGLHGALHDLVRIRQRLIDCLLDRRLADRDQN
jgi:hypothetical protein